MNPRKHIVLIDDSALVRDMASDTLRNAGHQVSEFGAMAEVENIGNDGIDLMLIDVQMPELFGDDLAMVLRSARGFECPIYLYSSLAASELEGRARRAGVDGYICKGEGLEHLLDQVQQILQESR